MASHDGIPNIFVTLIGTTFTSGWDHHAGPTTADHRNTPMIVMIPSMGPLNRPK